MKKASVGLIVLTDIPGMGMVAVLQRRGEFNHEKMALESYPGACQVTVHGKIEESDDSISGALIREAREELGEKFGGLVLNHWNNVRVLNYVDDGREVVTTYGLKLDCSFLKELRLSPSSGGLKFLPREELDSIVDIQTIDKRIGVKDRFVIAMFSDDKDAVRLAFEKLI